jgi:large subunit ribosomal protein L4
VLDKLGVDGRVLVVLDRDDTVAIKSLRNLPNVHLLEAGQLNAYDVLVSDWVVFTEAALPKKAEATPQDAPVDTEEES